MSKYISVLKYWLGNDSEIFTTSEVMREIQAQSYVGPLVPDEKCRSERRFYVKYGLLYPPREILVLRELRLYDLFKPPFEPDKLREYIEKNWKFNQTLVDSDWQKDVQGKNP